MRTTVSPSFRNVCCRPGGTSTNVPGAGDDDLVLDGEGQLALEDVEGVVLGRVRVDRRAAAVRLDLDHGKVERVRRCARNSTFPTPVTYHRRRRPPHPPAAPGVPAST